MSELFLRWFVLTVDVSLKTLILAAAAGSVLGLLRVRNSNIKHAAWLSVLFGMLALPFLSAILPAVRVPLKIAPEALLALDRDSTRAVETYAPAAAPTASERIEPEKPSGARQSIAWGAEEMAAPSRAELHTDGTRRSPALSTPEGAVSVAEAPPIADPGRWLAIAAVVWFAGMLAFALRLLVGLFLGRRLVRRASVVEAAPDARLAKSAPFLVCESAEIRVPVSTGLFGPTILLPSDWRNWSEEKFHAVLVHEESHLRRKDSWVALTADLCRCMYWFHPVAWWVRSRLAALAEEACDDATIGSTGNRTAYAHHLLEFAGVLSGHPGRVISTGQSMARRSTVESRIHAILDFGRPLSSRLSWSGTLLIAAVVVPVVSVAAALRPSVPVKSSPPVGTVSQTNTVAAAPVTDAIEQPTERAAPRRPAGPTKDSGGPIATNGTRKRHTEPDAKDVTFAFAGTVVGPDGQPVDRAKVSLSFLRKTSTDNPPAGALTDQLGKFAFAVQTSELSDALPSLFSIGLVAEKEGFGFASGPAANFETTGRFDAELTDQQRNRMQRMGGKQPNVLELVLDDVPVRGRLVNTEGRPISGAKIEVVSVVTQDRPLDAWEAEVKKNDRRNPAPRRSVQWQYGRMLFEAYPGAATLRIEEGAEKSNRVFLAQQFWGSSRATIVPAVRTDADGRFTLKGLGRDRIVEFVVSAPGIETTHEFLRTRRGELIRSREPVYPSEFTLVAAPSVPVEGHVVDSKTRQHLAGVRVQSTTVLFSRTVSDADGKYRLEGLPSGSSQLSVIPPTGSQHLAGGVEVKTTLGSAPVVRDIKLTRGVLVRGRATDKQTGEPVRGTLSYYAYRSNPHIKESDSLAQRSPEKEFTTDADGRFELPALPGPGILGIAAGPRFPFGVGRDRIGDPTARDLSPTRTAPGFSFADNFNLLVPLNPEPGAKALTVNLALRSASDVTGRVLSPEGQPLADYFVYGLQPGRVPWSHNAGGQFKVIGYFPTETRRLIFYHPSRNLAGYYDLNGEPPAALEIKLHPAATLVGRALGTDGNPLANASIFSETRPLHPSAPLGPMGPLRRNRGNLAANSRDTGVLPFSGGGHPFRTDAHGRFELKGVIPGLKYTAKIEEPDKDDRNEERMMRPRPFFTIFTDLTVASGETRQLGDLKVKPDEPQPGRRFRPSRSPSRLPPPSQLPPSD